MFVEVGHQQLALIGPYMDRGQESRNEGRPWNGNLIGKLLLTITMAYPERFTPKNKPVIYTRVLVELYNCRICKQIYEIYGMVEFEKIHTLIAKNPRNLYTY